MEDLKSIIRGLCFTISQTPKLNNRVCIKSWWENRNLTKEYQSILDNTSWIPDKEFSRKLHAILNDLVVNPKCVYCDTPTTFKNFKEGYFLYCSNKCATSSPDRNQKLHINRDYSSINKKTKQTNLKKYGVDSFFKTEEFKEKSDQTKTIRYNNPNYNNPTKNKITCLDKYGVDHYEKLNTSHVSFDDVFRLHFEDKLNCGEIAEIFNTSTTFITKLIHKHGYIPLTYSVSSHERNISSWLTSINIPHEMSNRKILSGKELDIYLPEHNLAVEINGLYWHSFKEKETKDQIYRHYNKRQACLDKGIKLIQFTDKEWKEKTDICKSIIYNSLGKYAQKIRASACSLYYPTNDEYKKFLEDNHIQGHINTSDRMALKFNDEIVAIMSTGKSRFHKNKRELLRFCVKKYTKVYGSASKLFSVLKYDGMVSYCSLDYFGGGIYQQLGFKFSHNSPPGYFYVRYGNQIVSRHNAQKSKLKELLSDYNKDFTEYENMFNHGYSRYWNCGNSVWIYN